MGRTLQEGLRIREVRDHRTGATVVALDPSHAGADRVSRNGTREVHYQVRLQVRDHLGDPVAPFGGRGPGTAEQPNQCVGSYRRCASKFGPTSETRTRNNRLSFLEAVADAV